MPARDAATPQPPPLSGRFEYRIRSYELGARSQASLTTVCHLLQDAASQNAHELGASPELLLERDMTWFLTRMHLVVERFPKWRDVVSVETWPADVQRPYVIRDFQAYDADGVVLARATSSWLLMDMVRRRPMRRVPPEILKLHPSEAVRALDDGPPRGSRLPELEPPAREVAVRVRGSDVDINGHVNHVFYIDQIEHALPAEERQIRELEIEFKAECHDGDEMRVATAAIGEEGAGAHLHSLVRLADGKEVVRARTVVARMARL